MSMKIIALMICSIVLVTGCSTKTETTTTETATGTTETTVETTMPEETMPTVQINPSDDNTVNVDVTPTDDGATVEVMIEGSTDTGTVETTTVVTGSSN